MVIVGIVKNSTHQQRKFLEEIKFFLLLKIILALSMVECQKGGQLFTVVSYYSIKNPNERRQ